MSSIGLKKELALVHYAKSGCSYDDAIKNFPGALTKKTLQKYVNSPKGKAYLSELMKDVERACKINKIKVVSEVMDIQQRTKKDEDYKTSLSALNSVSKMMGYDAPTQVNVDMDLSSWLVNQSVNLPNEEQDLIEIEPVWKGDGDDG